MNRIKEVLEEKGLNKSGLPRNTVKATIWLMAIYKTNSNPDKKLFLKLLKY